MSSFKIFIILTSLFLTPDCEPSEQNDVLIKNFSFAPLQENAAVELKDQKEGGNSMVGSLVCIVGGIPI